MATRTITKEQLFLEQAPSFNFELDAEQLLEKALELGFVKKHPISTTHDNKTLYIVNDNY